MSIHKISNYADQLYQSLGKLELLMWGPQHMQNPTISNPGDKDFVDFRGFLEADFSCPA